MSYDWSAVFDSAKSKKDFERTGALIEAVKMFEKRLNDLGFFRKVEPLLKPKERLGVGIVFRIAYDNNMFGPYSAYLDRRLILKTISKRNALAHDKANATGGKKGKKRRKPRTIKPPTPDQCLKFVVVLANAVESLSDFKLSSAMGSVSTPPARSRVVRSQQGIVGVNNSLALSGEVLSSKDGIRPLGRQPSKDTKSAPAVRSISPQPEKRSSRTGDRTDSPRVAENAKDSQFSRNRSWPSPDPDTIPTVKTKPFSGRKTSGIPAGPASNPSAQDPFSVLNEPSTAPLHRVPREANPVAIIALVILSAVLLYGWYQWQLAPNLERRSSNARSSSGSPSTSTPPVQLNQTVAQLGPQNTLDIWTASRQISGRRRGEVVGSKDDEERDRSTTVV